MPETEPGRKLDDLIEGQDPSLDGSPRDQQ